MVPARPGSTTALVIAIDQRAAEVPPGHGWGFVQHAEIVGALDRAGARVIVLHNFERLPNSNLVESPALVRVMAQADKVAVGTPGSCGRSPWPPTTQRTSC